MSSLKLFLASIIISLSSLFSPQQAAVPAVPTPFVQPVQVVATTTEVITATTSEQSSSTSKEAPHSTATTSTKQLPVKTMPTKVTASSGAHVYTDDELFSMAGNPYASGEVPLGDGKYVTSSPKVGYVYLCNAHKDDFGSDKNGPWIHGTTWNFLSKLTVSGAVSWSAAKFSNIITGAVRTLTGNDLPINHTTGTFPIASSDAVAAYDRNPNSISSQALKDEVPADPTYSETPYCMGGEAGVMLSGVALFDALDAPLRDAPAHEAQDSCGGHPQESGEYHYHSLSPCFKDIGEKTVLGYALDGFPITGPEVAKNKYLTTDDLDVCHGLTSEIVVDGKKKISYHYVMTQDYPYSVSCFRGKPTRTGPSSIQAKTTVQTAPITQQHDVPQETSQGGTPPTPPQEAQDACDNLDEGVTCQVGAQMTGTCQIRGEYFACIPN
jgi:hypothetical protein